MKRTLRILASQLSDPNASNHIVVTAAIQSVITTNKKGTNFYVVFGDTFPIKDKLGNMGFRYFKGTWGIPATMAKDEKRRKALEELGIDTSPLDKPAVQAPPQPTQPTQQTSQPESDMSAGKAGTELNRLRKELQKQMENLPPSEAKSELTKFVHQSIERIANSTDEAAKSELVKGFLDFSSRFHQYSVMNQLLIWFQKPNASYISGFRQWLDKGRQVTDWGAGITIYGPRQGKRKSNLTEDQKKGMSPEQVSEAESDTQYTYFVALTVYDISSTIPLPDWKDKNGKGPFEPNSWRSDTNTPEEQISTLVEAALGFATDMGVKSEFSDTGSAYGVSRGGEIAISNVIDGVNKLTTVVHEMAHEALHRDDTREGMSRNDREVEAEATAYIVARHYGYESKDTPNYLALWKATGEDVRKRRSAINAAVHTIIEGINSKMASVVQPEEQEAPTEQAAQQPMAVSAEDKSSPESDRARAVAEMLYEKEDFRSQVFDVAYETFPMHNTEQSLDATDYIVEQFEKEFGGQLVNPTWDEVEPHLYEMVMAGLT